MSLWRFAEGRSSPNPSRLLPSLPPQRRAPQLTGLNSSSALVVMWMIARDTLAPLSAIRSTKQSYRILLNRLCDHWVCEKVISSVSQRLSLRGVDPRTTLMSLQSKTNCDVMRSLHGSYKKRRMVVDRCPRNKVLLLLLTSSLALAVH